MRAEHFVPPLRVANHSLAGYAIAFSLLPHMVHHHHSSLYSDNTHCYAPDFLHFIALFAASCMMSELVTQKKEHWIKLNVAVHSIMVQDAGDLVLMTQIREMNPELPVFVVKVSQ